jgi:transposase
MMLPSQPNRIFIAVGSTDMRKSINGLSIMVEQIMGQDPFTGDLFVFCNRRRNMIKILYWDCNGFCVWLKRLEEHRFTWPRTREEIITIGSKELEWLLAGFDYTRAHKRIRYSVAG